MSRRQVLPSDDLLPMVDQALLVLGGTMDTRSAAAMLAWIALQESDHLTATVQRGGGPARGLCQIKPGIYRDSMAQARKRPDTLGAVVRCHAALLFYPHGEKVAFYLHQDPDHEKLGHGFLQTWAMGVARIVLEEATSQPLPECPTWRGLDFQFVKNRERDEFEKACSDYRHRYWCRGCGGEPRDFRTAIRWGYERGIDPLTYEPIAGRW